MVKTIALLITLIISATIFIALIRHTLAILPTVQNRADIECPADYEPVNLGTYGLADRNWQCARYVDPL